MFWLIRKQIFLDGNKRTAMLIANKILISTGCGIIAIQEQDLETFGKKLIKFYETNDMTDVKDFVYKNELTGFDSNKAVQENN